MTWAGATRLVIIAGAAALGAWLVYELRSVLLQLLVALILATGLARPVEALHRRGLPRPAAVLLIYAAFIGGLTVLVIAIAPPVARQTEAFIAEAPRYGDWLVALLQDLRTQFPFLPPLDEQLTAQLRGVGSQIGAIATQAARVASVVVGIFTGILSAVVVLLLTLYLVADARRIRAYVLTFFPAERHARLRHIAHQIGSRMGGWLIGQAVLCISIGLMSYAGLALMGVRGALILAVVAAIGEAIPIVGPIISAVPAVIVALTQSPGLALAVLVLYLIIQQLENNLLVPRIMGQAVNVHPLAVILAILIGGQLLGVVGAIVAVPVAAAIAVLLDELRHHDSATQASAAQAAQPVET